MTVQARMARSASRPPSRLLLLSEGRAFFELGAGVALWPLLQLAPRGDGHPVLVLPGFLASDVSTLFLRSISAAWDMTRKAGILV